MSVVVREGQATRELTPFKRVIGVDPSSKMIEQAHNYAVQLGDSVSQLEFVQSKAEDLSFLKDGTADMIIAGVCPLFHCASFGIVPDEHDTSPGSTLVQLDEFLA
jgi:SAM-dependent methyltransferase